MKRFRYILPFIAALLLLFAACGDDEEEAQYPYIDGPFYTLNYGASFSLVDENGHCAITSKGLVAWNFRIAYERNGEFYVPEDEPYEGFKMIYPEDDPANPYIWITIKPEYCGLPPYFDLSYTAPEEGETGRGTFRVEYNDGEWVSGPIGFTAYARDSIAENHYKISRERHILDITYDGKTYQTYGYGLDFEDFPVKIVVKD